jgi:16S rRNA (guanine966-N2)-methyltransferase
MSSLRITAGALRGRRVPVPKGDVRPTSERARQAYFNIAGDRVRGAAFLDLFAGSGIFSFEALSRGAASATAVDESAANMKGLAAVAQSLQVQVETITGDVLGVLKRLRTRQFDLIYADPPYDYRRYDELLLALDSGPAAPDALVAIEHRRKSAPFTITPARLSLRRQAEYGEVWITFFSSLPQALQ